MSSDRGRKTHMRKRRILRLLGSFYRTLHRQILRLLWQSLRLLPHNPHQQQKIPPRLQKRPRNNHRHHLPPQKSSLINTYDGLPAVGFIVDNDIDGFKELLYSDDTLYFPKPEIFDAEEKNSLSAPVSATARMNAPCRIAIHFALANLPTLHSLKPSRIIEKSTRPTIFNLIVLDFLKSKSKCNFPPA